MTKGTVIQFRRGRHTQQKRHFIVEIEGVKDKKGAEPFLGSFVEWSSSAGKKLKGKVSGTHGNKGLVRVIFERGLPGQALLEEVTFVSPTGGKK